MSQLSCLSPEEMNGTGGHTPHVGAAFKALAQGEACMFPPVERMLRAPSLGFQRKRTPFSGALRMGLSFFWSDWRRHHGGCHRDLPRLAGPHDPCRLPFKTAQRVFRVSAFPFFQRAFRPCLWAQRLGVQTTGLGGISWDNQTLAPLKGEPQGDWLNNGCSFFPGLPSTCLRRFHSLRCHLLCAMRSLLLIVTRRLASRFVQLGAPLHWRVLCLVYPGACLLLPFASVHCFLHARPSHAASRLRPVRGPFLSLRGHL